jgi:hypothetical protein
MSRILFCRDFAKLDAELLRPDRAITRRIGCARSTSTTDGNLVRVARNSIARRHVVCNAARSTTKYSNVDAIAK